MSFIKLLWNLFTYNSLFVVATGLGFIIEAFIAANWSPWRLVPIIPLSLCIVYFIGYTSRVYKTLNPGANVAYSICIGKSWNWFENTAKRDQEQCLEMQNFSWHDVKKLYRIHNQDWVFFSERELSAEPEDWTKIMLAIFEHFGRYAKRIDTQRVYHFFFVAPPSICFGFGAIVGRNVPHCTYHYTRNLVSPYVKIFDSTKTPSENGMQKLSVRVPLEKMCSVSLDIDCANGDEFTIVILDMTGHSISESNLSTEGAREIVRVRHANGIGHFPVNDWEQVARESASVILHYSDLGTPLHLYVNTPLPLAFLIGSIVGYGPEITLHEHNKLHQKTIKCFDLSTPEFAAYDLQN